MSRAKAPSAPAGDIARLDACCGQPEEAIDELEHDTRRRLSELKSTPG